VFWTAIFQIGDKNETNIKEKENKEGFQTKGGKTNE